MKSYSSREIIKLLENDGWYLFEVRGDHYQFKHPVKKGKITVTHPKKDIPIGTVKQIIKQSGIILKEGY
ncbi:MAG: type II toxin-antitoxin system HicA family toxin [Firmicutes bacterium]|nr:type II toxin-antitoxin system HicA family toxin [Bacillota bacterium]